MTGWIEKRLVVKLPEDKFDRTFLKNREMLSVIKCSDETVAIGFLEIMV